MSAEFKTITPSDWRAAIKRAIETPNQVSQNIKDKLNEEQQPAPKPEPQPSLVNPTPTKVKVPSTNPGRRTSVVVERVRVRLG